MLRHREDDVAITLEPALEGFTSEDLAKGTLYVIERYVSFELHSKPLTMGFSQLVFFSATGKGFDIKYPSITLHAISRTETGPSIYCQLDESAAPAANGDTHAHANGDAEGGAEEDIPEMRELTIKPQNASSRTLRPHPEAHMHLTTLNPS